jgi:hypothetical protein
VLIWVIGGVMRKMRIAIAQHIATNAAIRLGKFAPKPRGTAQNGEKPSKSTQNASHDVEIRDSWT